MLDIRKITTSHPQYHKKKKIVGLVHADVPDRIAPKIQKLENLKLKINYKQCCAHLNFDKEDAILALAFIFIKARLNFKNYSENTIYINNEVINEFNQNDVIEENAMSSIVNFRIEYILNSTWIKEKNTISVATAGDESAAATFYYRFTHPIYIDKQKTDDAKAKLLKNWNKKPRPSDYWYSQIF